MNLLFDQNISYRIVDRIKDIYPESRQVLDVNLQNTTDSKIWEYAKANNFCIVTFDSDFYDLSIVKGSPPRIIWLRTGNTTTSNIEKILRDNQILIKEFLNNPEYSDISCLEIE